MFFDDDEPHEFSEQDILRLLFSNRIIWLDKEYYYKEDSMQPWTNWAKTISECMEDGYGRVSDKHDRHLPWFDDQYIVLPTLKAHWRKYYYECNGIVI